MNAGLQGFNIGTMLANTRVNGELFDVHAYIDRSLHLDENITNIRRIHGIQTRDYGSEHLEQRRHERAREHARKVADPLWQTGPIQNPFNKDIDRRFQAMRPGKRFSASGHIYYERRENRSDRGKLL